MPNTLVYERMNEQTKRSKSDPSNMRTNEANHWYDKLFARSSSMLQLGKDMQTAYICRYALADNTYLLIPPFQYTQIILVQFNCGFLCKPINLCLCKCEFPYRICLIIIIIFCCGSGK